MTMNDLVLINDTTRFWEERISAAWRETIEGIFRVGDLLIEAKADPVCRFDDMELPFERNTTQRLMLVAQTQWLRNGAHAPRLPASWMTLYELTKLDDDELDARLKAGDITPELERPTVEGWRKKTRRTARERDLAAATKAASTELGIKLYSVILADPPWRFEPFSRDTGMDRSADNHYPTMTLDDIKAHPVPAAKDCVLFLWATVPMLPEALEVMVAWDFEYKSNFVWVKHTPGTGYWSRNRHELLLVGTRGSIPAPAPGDQYESVIEARAGPHSQKPFHFHEIIEDYFPLLPRIELFARQTRTGWDSWGNEVHNAA
jgi:N6-adenosine-specific RNA methylase IME4